MRSIRLGAVLAALVAALAACGGAVQPATDAAPVASVPGSAVDASAISIRCPARGAFSNGPTYWSQFYEDYVLSYVFSDQKTGFYVDVGANDPDASSVTKYFYLAGWRGINIEPIPDLVTKLNAVRPGDVNKGVAISDAPGTLKFFKAVRFSGLSTLDADIAATHKAKGVEFEEIMIPVTTLTVVLDEHAKDQPEITFMNADVEGFERQVFSSIDFTRYHPRVIMAESTAPLSEVDTHDKWESILFDNGYIFALDDGLNRYYVHATQESLLPRFVEASYCVGRDKLEKRIHLDGFKTR